MTPADKQKLSAAFRKALTESPNADLPIEGMEINGQPATQRLMIAETLGEASFYSAVDKVLAVSGMTLDAFISDMAAEIKATRR